VAGAHVHVDEAQERQVGERDCVADLGGHGAAPGGFTRGEIDGKPAAVEPIASGDVLTSGQRIGDALLF